METSSFFGTLVVLHDGLLEQVMGKNVGCFDIANRWKDPG